MTARAGGLLLAAGGGSRLGRPKALVEIAGELLVERGARMLAAGGCEPVVVVVGAAADEVDRRARLDGVAEVVDNPAWQDGIASSLRAGLDALAGRCGAVVVALADQPRVGAEAVARLITAWRDGAVAAVADYGPGRPPNPVLLDASVWEEVAAAAHGDVGARRWLATYPERVTAVDCTGTGVPTDVDTPADLSALRPPGD